MIQENFMAKPSGTMETISGKFVLWEGFLFPWATSQADMLACPFGGAVCRWHTVSADRSEAKTKYPADLQRCKFDAS